MTVNSKNIFLLFFSLFTSTSGFAIDAGKSSEAQQIITKSESHVVNKAPDKIFTGNAAFSRFPVLPSSGSVAPAIVTFEAGAYTNWHIHPHGQYLIVTGGEGRTQEWGQPIQTLGKGDVVWCPPGVKHWHGASTHSAMTHIAISPVATDGKKVTWLEKVDLPTERKKNTTAPSADAEVKLTKKQLALISIAAFTAIGDIEKLKPTLTHGLESGLTVNEIKEVFAHQYAYVGFPRALNAMLTFRSLLDTREKQGIKDVPGPTPGQLPDDTNYYQLGNQTLSRLTNRPLEEASKPLFDNFSPTIDYALKTHLFGYLFSRDNLGYLERELVVVSTLSALGNVNAQLRSHLNIANNLGVNKNEMEKIFKTLEQDLGTDIADNARDVWQQIK